MVDHTPNVSLRRCSTCERLLPATLEYFSARHRKCRECRRASDRIYRQTPERKTAKRAYEQDPKNKARERARQQTPKYKAAKRTLEQTPKTKASRQSIRQSEKGRELSKIKSQRRRNRKRKLLATFTAADWSRAIDYFDGCCAVCGRPRGLWHTLAQDHWIPLSQNGSYTPDNVVPLCHALKDGDNGCNNSKYNISAHEWLMKKFGKRKASQIEKRIAEYFEWIKESDGKNPSSLR